MQFSWLKVDENSIKDAFKSVLSSVFLDELGNKVERKMERAVTIVHNTATKKRALIESPSRTGNAVSNPNAAYGVPVRTGKLRSSIFKEVKKGGGHVIGRVWQDGAIAPYGKYLEYGTSKMQARPFMRPALDLNREAIDKLFKEKE